MADTNFVVAGKSLTVYDQRTFRQPTILNIDGKGGINVSIKRNDETGEITIKVYG